MCTEMYVDILLAILGSGIIMIIIEVLHLQATLSNKYYDIISPFMKKLFVYVNLVAYVDNVIIIKNSNSEYADKLKDIISKISKLAREYIVRGLKINELVSTAKDIESLSSKINNIWYFVVEKQLTVEFDKEFHLESNSRIKKLISQLSSDYKERTFDVDLFTEISADFYVNEYLPIQNIFYEFEYLRNRMKKVNIFMCLVMLLTLMSVIVLSTMCICMLLSAIITVVISSFFMIGIYLLVDTYHKSITYLK